MAQGAAFSGKQAADGLFGRHGTGRHGGGRIPGAHGQDGESRAAIVARLDALSRLLDTAFAIPGTRIRFGIDGVIGLVPGIGDLVSTALSGYLIWEARRLGLPRWIIARMMANVAVDAAIGVVPFLGDAVDVFFKANRRNMRLLLNHLERTEPGLARAGGVRADGLEAGFGPVIDADYTVGEPGRRRPGRGR